MKNFLNYFALKIILLNILQNVTIHLNILFDTLVIPRNDIFLYYRINQISFDEILFWCQSKSNSIQMFDWLMISSLLVSSLKLMIRLLLKIMASLNNCINTYRFKACSYVFCSFYMIREICVFC